MLTVRFGSKVVVSKRTICETANGQDPSLTNDRSHAAWQKVTLGIVAIPELQKRPIRVHLHARAYFHSL